MQVVDHKPYLSVDEYLAGEQHSDVRYEYVDGEVFALAGAAERHNRIAGNIFFHLRAAARGGPCGVFISDMKVRLQARNALYYPDVLVTCDPADCEPLYKTRPFLIVEVLSPATEVIDRREKLTGYRTLPSLTHYLLVAQDCRRVELYRREEDGHWSHTVFEESGHLDARATGFAASLSQDDIYEDVVLAGSGLTF